MTKFQVLDQLCVPCGYTLYGSVQKLSIDKGYEGTGSLPGPH
jgi:hypothetical protein